MISHYLADDPFSKQGIDHLKDYCQRLVSTFPLLFGYGLVLYRYSQPKRRMVEVLTLQSDETMVAYLKRCIPALAGKAVAVYNQAAVTGRVAIIPYDTKGGESFFTVATPNECLIIGCIGGNTATNHQIINGIMEALAEHLEPDKFENPKRYAPAMGHGMAAIAV